MKYTLIVTLTILFLSISALAGDAQDVKIQTWKPVVYDGLSKQSQRIIDFLPYVDSRNNILLHYFLRDVQFANCTIQSLFKDGRVQILIRDIAKEELYVLNFKKFESKAGPIFNPTDTKNEYYLAITDSEDVDGMTIEGETYTLQVKVEKATGAVVQVHLFSELKTIFSGGFATLGNLIGRKPVESGLNVICKN